MTRQLVVHKRDPHDVYIGRPGPWGNPFVIGEHGTREEVIAAYEAHLRFSPELRKRLPELRGKVLGCWCAPQPCHGDVLAKWANASRRILITCSRTWQDWNRAGRVLGYVYQRAPDAILVSGHAWKGDRDLERIWEGLGGTVETHEADWQGPCRDSCKRGHRRPGRNGEFCPAAGDYRNIDMAQLPDVVLCLAFIGPCVKDPCYSELPEPHGSHGVTQCATYAQFRVHIPTKRFPYPGLLA